MYNNCTRLDREDKGEGGELAFIKKGIIIKKQELTDFESIYIQLYIDGQLVNIILSYKSPSVKNDEFLEKLENFIMLLDPCESLFIVGDLNMDLRSVKGFDLKNFLIRNELKNYVEQHTRVCRSYYKKKKRFIKSKTLIDVIIHNQNRVVSSQVIGCPFSDHKFIIAALDFTKTKTIKFTNTGRSLSEKNLILISDHLKAQDFSFDTNEQDIDMIWTNQKEKIISILDLVAPVKTFKERPQEICPWVDDEILGKRKARDHFYFKFHNSNTPFSCSDDYKKYQLLRTECQSLERKKMKDYFSSKKISDFKNNKLYWEFYSSSIKVKTCKTDNITSNYFLHEEREYTDPEEIGNVFNSFFTNLSSTSLSSESDCDSYIDKTFPG